MGQNMVSEGVDVARIYRALRLIRRVEEEIARIYPSDKIRSPVHLLIGQESVAVGVCDVVHEQLGALKAVADVHEAER